MSRSGRTERVARIPSRTAISSGLSKAIGIAVPLDTRCAANDVRSRVRARTSPRQTRSSIDQSQLDCAGCERLSFKGCIGCYERHMVKGRGVSNPCISLRDDGRGYTGHESECSATDCGHVVSVLGMTNCNCTESQHSFPFVEANPDRSFCAPIPSAEENALCQHRFVHLLGEQTLSASVSSAPTVTCMR